MKHEARFDKICFVPIVFAILKPKLDFLQHKQHNNILLHLSYFLSFDLHLCTAIAMLIGGAIFLYVTTY